MTTNVNNALTDKISDLKSAVDDISTNTFNLFDPYSIVIGKNGTGATGYPKRAISSIMYVGANGAQVKAVSLPSNLKYDVERYNGNDYSTRSGSSSWITDDTLYRYAYTNEYIAILFASVNDQPLTESDFNGLKLQINSGTSLLDYEPHLTADDLNAKRSIKYLQNSHNPKNLFPLNGWEYGSLTSGAFPETTATTRVRTHELIPIEGGKQFGAFYGEIPDGTRYRIAIHFYDANEQFLRETNYDKINFLNIPTNAAYMRIVLAHFPATSASSLALDPKSSPYIANINLYYATHESNTTDLTVCTFNVGRYNYGVTPAGIADNIYDEKNNQF